MSADKSPPRLVIDTNVFVSGLISASGFPARILGAIHQRKAIHLVSDPIIEEYLRVLNYPRIRKFRNVTDVYLTEVAAYLTYETERVEIASTIRLSPDPDDDMFLETAVDGRATLIVTGDKADLLSLSQVEGIPVVAASEAAKRLGISG